MASVQPVFLGDTYTVALNSMPAAANFVRTAGGVWLPMLGGADGSVEVSSASTPTTPEYTRFAQPTTSPYTRALVNISTATTTHVITGTAAQVIRIYRMVLNISAAQTLDIQTTTASATLIGGAWTFTSGEGIILDADGEIWLSSLSADGIDFVTTTTGIVRGFVDYIKS